MSDSAAVSLRPARPEFERQVSAPVGLGDVAKPLSLAERLSGNAALRRGLILVGIALVWELYARWLANPLTFPTFLETLEALRQGQRDGSINGELDAEAAAHAITVEGVGSAFLWTVDPAEDFRRRIDQWRARTVRTLGP